MEDIEDGGHAEDAENVKECAKQALAMASAEDEADSSAHDDNHSGGGERAARLGCLLNFRAPSYNHLCGQI
eukprot:5432587-Amphidinium_carterae.1